MGSVMRTGVPQADGTIRPEAFVLNSSPVESTDKYASLQCHGCRSRCSIYRLHGLVPSRCQRTQPGECSKSTFLSLHRLISLPFFQTIMATTMPFVGRG